MAFSSEDFPKLHPGNHEEIADSANRRNNCIAWAAGHDDQWWEAIDPPTGEIYWPEDAPRDDRVTSLVIVFELNGFAVCADGSLEDGFEKIVIYADGETYTHAARQLESGRWTSKMGRGVRIEHDAPEDLAGPAYGNVSIYMKRKRA